jgi:glycosyltransferase involved in cell wall biosynthesis
VKNLPEIHNYAVLLDGHPNNQVTKLPFFQFVRPGMEYPQWLEFLKQARVVVDSYHNMHTYGRNAVDCACLKVPVIGSDVVHAQKILFPELTTEPNDVLEQRSLLKKLISDEKFYREVTDYAYEKVDIFGYESSAEKFENMIKDYRETSSQGK